jgi:hypothetical protein
MSDELLRRASEALRASADGTSDRAQETRARLLAGAQLGRRRRRRWLVGLLPLAAALAAASAWAAATGRLSAAWHEAQNLAQPMTSARADIGPSAHCLVRIMASSQPSSQQAAAPSMQPEANPATAATIEALQARFPVASGGTENSAPGPSSASAPAAPSSGPRHDAGDADHAAYLAAHRAHFGGGSPLAALAAWDDYLRDFPSGRFSLEARYNRALCLVKLGRNAEAAQALKPFARGAYGTYRQAESKALREALGAQ